MSSRIYLYNIYIFIHEEFTLCINVCMSYENLLDVCKIMSNYVNIDLYNGL
jgi:hypothetical protein